MLCNSPVEERPDSPHCREQDQLRCKCDLDELYLHFSGQLLRHENTCSIRANNALKWRNEEGEWQGHALDDEESNVSVWCDATHSTFDMVL